LTSNALHLISYGLYTIGAAGDGGIQNAQIANSLIQVCSDPQIVAVCLNKKNYTHELVERSKVFSASILVQDTPLGFIGGLGFKSGRDVDKLQALTLRKGQTGAPIVTDHALAFIEATVIDQMTVGTHTVFAAEVAASEVLNEGEPLTYAYYQQVKRGTTPKTAPSYIEKKKEENPKMDKYECTVCGYIYDPEVGDPESNIPPGTPFEKLPDDWQCPVCGASKDEFQKVS